MFGGQKIQRLENPPSSIAQMLQTADVPNHYRFLQKLIKTFNILLAVTRKICQRNYLEKMVRLGLPTNHAVYVADCIISATKSTMKSDGKQKQSMAMFVMHIKFQDAELDLKETEERAYRSIGEDLDEMRQILDKKRFNDFKSNFFR